MPNTMKHLRPRLNRLRGLARDTSAVALIEFALSLPLLLIFGLGGLEVANYSLAHMRVSQVAISLADNASRAKQEVATGAPRMREWDVNEVFTAAELQGSDIDITQNGRLILSSLEVNADGGQWIHWQRCFGDAPYSSSYGVEGDGATGTSVTGMGPAGGRVAAADGFAIMVVEVVYDYQPITDTAFTDFMPDVPIRKFAAMYVRDDRDLDGVGTGLYNTDPVTTQNLCT